MSRVWPGPDLRDGTTVSLTTDTHAGEKPFSNEFFRRTGEDLDAQAAHTHGFIHTGDGVHWANPTPEDAEFKAWLQARRTNTGKPWVAVAGNHDLASYIDPKPWRTAAAWATSVGANESGDDVQDMGDMRVIGISPEDWINDPVTGWGHLTLSPAKLAWLDGQLSATNRPCWIAIHSAPEEQYGGTAHIEPIAAFAELIGSHSNAVGVLSGHLHAAFKLPRLHTRSVAMGGRRVFTVNGAASGGTMNGIAHADHQWQSPSISTFITYKGDAIDVRWRNHLERRWDVSAYGKIMTVRLAG